MDADTDTRVNWGDAPMDHVSDNVAVNPSSDIAAASSNTVISYAGVTAGSGDPVPLVNNPPVRSRFVPSTFERENFSVHNRLPERPCSAFFPKPDGDFALKDLFADLETCQIPSAAVRCVQWVSPQQVCVTFAKEDYRNTFLRASSLVPRFLRSGAPASSGNPRIVYVAVFGAPYELPDSALHKRLAPFGTVKFTRRSKHQNYPALDNGTRVFGMVLSKSIPSFLRFGRVLVRVRHDNQTPTCRKCNLPDHIAKDCPNTFCYNCERTGHMFKECSEQDFCCVCREQGHRAIDCQHSWYRRPRSYRDADKPDDPPPQPSSDLQPTVQPSNRPSQPPSQLSSSCSSQSSSQSSSLQPSSEHSAPSQMQSSPPLSSDLSQSQSILASYAPSNPALVEAASDAEVAYAMDVADPPPDSLPDYPDANSSPDDVPAPDAGPVPDADLASDDASIHDADPDLDPDADLPLQTSRSMFSDPSDHPLVVSDDSDSEDDCTPAPDPFPSRTLGRAVKRGSNRTPANVTPTNVPVRKSTNPSRVPTKKSRPS